MTEMFPQQVGVSALEPQEVAAAVATLETTSQAERAVQVAHMIDPEGVLPVVEIVPDPSVRVGRGSLAPQQSLIMHQGVQIGKCTLVSDNRGQARWFNGIEVNEKGKGYGSAAYKAAITQAMLDGYDFRTHEWSQTEGAKNVWERFAATELARVEKSFEPDGTGRFNGVYVIDAIKKSN